MKVWLLTKLEGFATAEVSTRSLGVIRICVMLILIHEFCGLLTTHRVDDHAGAVILSWVVMATLGFGLVGYKTRWAIGLMAVAFGVLHIYYGFILGDKYLAKPVQVFQVVVLLWLTPSGRSLSVDRYLAVERAAAEGSEPPPERMPWWQLELYLLEICSIYFWAAENKTGPGWLNGERMERYYIEWYGSSDVFTTGRGQVLHAVSVVLAWATTILEFGLSFGLLSRRARPWIAIGGVMLHLGIMFMFSVTFFTSMMFTLLLAAIPPQQVHDFIEDLME